VIRVYNPFRGQRRKGRLHESGFNLDTIDKSHMVKNYLPTKKAKVQVIWYRYGYLPKPMGVGAYERART
jgi:hypothetical protein